VINRRHCHQFLLITSLVALTSCGGGPMLGIAPPRSGVQPALSDEARTHHAASVVVTRDSDDGPGSLREALKIAKSGATVTFRLPKKAVILLTAGPITIGKRINILGPGPSALTISAAGKSGIFVISRTAEVAVAGLKFTKGRAATGGAITNAGSLTIQNAEFMENSAVAAGASVRPTGGMPGFDPRPRRRGGRPARAPRAKRVAPPDAGSGFGGAIYNEPDAVLSLSSTILQKNSAPSGGAVYNAGSAQFSQIKFQSNKSLGTGYGGALYVDGKTVISQCIFSKNVSGGNVNAATGIGGAIAQYGGTLNVSSTTFSGNVAGGDTDASWGVGGAVYSTSGTLYLKGDTFISNRASGADFGLGGALYADQHFGGDTNLFSGNAAEGLAAGGYAYGGAIFAGNGLTLSGGTFTANTASGGTAPAGYAIGGALESEGPATLSAIAFTSNSAVGGDGGSAEAGAVYAGGSSVFTALTFTGNTATATGSASYAVGGAVLTFAQLSMPGTTTFDSNVVAVANTSSLGGVGGAVAVEGGPFTFSGTATKNVATTQGAAFWIDGAATLQNSIISQNAVSAVQSAADGGGGIYISIGGNVTLTGSTLTANSTSGTVAETGGGAIFNGGLLAGTNSTITGNTSSEDGGGIENDSSLGATLYNVTVYQNVAGGTGGSLKNLFSDSAVTIANSIFAGGTGGGVSDDISNDGSIVSGDYNIVQTAPTGKPLSGGTANNLNADPQLAALADNGGPTPTNADAAGGPGTGHIPFNLCLANDIITDQRGYPRNATNNGYCDVGAYENQSP
jgi:predicted outer membrane repeat protein